jgi:hypothetical protein
MPGIYWNTYKSDLSQLGCADLHHSEEKQHHTGQNRLLRAQQVPDVTPYPMAKIPDIFRGLEWFQYATMIDLSMGYYSMPLSEQANALCVISLPRGLHQYTVLPQGINLAMDIFQQLMGALFLWHAISCHLYGRQMVFGYIDFGMHLVDVTEVLKHLSEAGMHVNPAKWMWFQSSVTYLGFQIIHESIKPQPDKVQGILNMKHPVTQKKYAASLAWSTSTRIYTPSKLPP